VPRVVRVGGIGLGRAGEHPGGWRPHVRLSLPPGRCHPSGAPCPTCDVPGDVTPFTRRLPEGNIGSRTGFSCEQYGGSRTGWLERRSQKGRATARSGPQGPGERFAGGCLLATGPPTTPSSRPAVRIAETPAAGPASRWGSHAREPRARSRTRRKQRRRCTRSAKAPAGRMVPSVMLRYERSALRLAESSPDAVGLTDA
jgi:hypothetical protein